jgi:S1-C subfamily serine protease
MDIVEPSVERVALLRVPGESGSVLLGSGYLVSQDIVVTAAHVVDHASAEKPILVFLPAEQLECPAKIQWLDRDLDVSLLSLETTSGRRGVPPLRNAINGGTGERRD